MLPSRCILKNLVEIRFCTTTTVIFGLGQPLAPNTFIMRVIAVVVVVIIVVVVVVVVVVVCDDDDDSDDERRTTNDDD